MKRRPRNKRSGTVPGEPKTELPAAYGVTRLRLMELDPYHIHAFWEVTPQDRQVAIKKAKSGKVAPAWALRFHDMGDGSSFDIPIDLAAGNWYVDLWAADKTYEAELGLLAVNGRFISVCRSNIARTPTAAPAPHDTVQWLQVEGAFEKMTPVSEPVQPVSLTPPEPVSAPVPAVQPEQHFPIVAPPVTISTSAAEPGEQVEVSTPIAATAEAVPLVTATAESPQPISSFSFESAGSFGLGSEGLGVEKVAPSINLELNAEVVVYGRAQPGQTLRVNGRWVPVNADGTFHVRWALPTAKP